MPFALLPPGYDDPIALLPAPAPPVRRPRRKARKPRVVNYAGRNRPKTELLHDAIAKLLHDCSGLSIREIGQAVGISRQLCLYHVKKMVAHDRLVAVLEPCEGNGGVRYCVWEKRALAITYTLWLASRAA